MMQPGEEKIVARRLRQVLEHRQGAASDEPKCAQAVPALVCRFLRCSLCSSWARSVRSLGRPRTPAPRAVSRPMCAPRNDILIENRVPTRMRDGVTLYADVYRPVGNGRHPVLVSRTPYSTERFPTAYEAAVYFAQRGYVYVYQDVRGRHESDGDLGAVLQQREGRLRHDRVGGEAALVRRQGRDAGRLLSRAEPMAGRAGRAAQPGHDLSDGGVHEHLPRLDHAQRRLAAVVQLRLGTRPAGVAHHAEPRSAHHRRASARSTTTRCSSTCR